MKACHRTASRIMRLAFFRTHNPLVLGSNPSGPTRCHEMYYLYILRSRPTGKYYVGSTEGLSRHLREHNGELPNPGKSTLAGRPWELVFQAGYPSRARAIAAERYVKNMKSKCWITRLVEGTYRLPEL